MTASYYALERVDTGCYGSQIERGNYIGKEVYLVICNHKDKKGKCDVSVRKKCKFISKSSYELKQEFFPNKTNDIASLLELD